MAQPTIRRQSSLQSARFNRTMTIVAACSTFPLDGTNAVRLLHLVPTVPASCTTLSFEVMGHNAHTLTLVEQVLDLPESLSTLALNSPLKVC
jgi:hypothetical protein